MKILSLDAILYIHEKTIEKHGGKDGVNNINLVKSALETPFLTFSGEDLNKTTLDKIAALTHSLINNHGFQDGNKRVGTIAMGITCKMNNIDLKFTQEELIEFGLSIAEGKWNKEDIKTWIIEHEE